MKLKSLYIQKYKNLAPITINFESGNGLTMLVGNNGSGKSNVLEAISGIFHDLFKGKDSRKIKCDYKLQYPYCYSGYLVSCSLHAFTAGATDNAFPLFPFLACAILAFVLTFALAVTQFGKKEMR